MLISGAMFEAEEPFLRLGFAKAGYTQRGSPHGKRPSRLSSCLGGGRLRREVSVGLERGQGLSLRPLPGAPQSGKGPQPASAGPERDRNSIRPSLRSLAEGPRSTGEAYALPVRVCPGSPGVFENNQKHPQPRTRLCPLAPPPHPLGD